MLKNILYYSMIPCVALNPIYVPIQKNYNETLIDSKILNDIKNINNSLDSDYFTRIRFTQKTMKQLFVLGWLTYWKKWSTDTIHDFNNSIEIDLENRIAKFNLFPDTFRQVYRDPDPAWCDPVGARWNNKTFDIKINYDKHKIKTLNEDKQWYGSKYQTSIEIRESELLNDNITVLYPTHDYFSHGIHMYVNGWYKIENLKKDITIFEISNQNIIYPFIEINRPTITNKNLIWNSHSIKQNKNLFSFSDNMRILKTLDYANEVISFLENFIAENKKNDLWLNSHIDEETIKRNIDNILNYRFDSYDDLILLKNNIANNSNHIINGSYIEKVKSLNNATNSYISTGIEINLSNASELYNILILIFKNNELVAEVKINNISYDIPIWSDGNFTNFFDYIKIDDTNTLVIEFEAIKINYICDINSMQKNDNLIFDDHSLLSKYNFCILYRYNALNIDDSIINENLRNGLLINANKYVSELVGTGIDINGYSKNYIISKKEILSLANELFENNNIFSDIIDFTKENELLLKNLFSDNLLHAWQSITSDDIFDFKANNYNGVFYGILKVNNWFFTSDYTDGDFTINFKNKFLDSIKDSKSIIEIKKVHSSIDSHGYFLCKFRTNKIIFNKINGKYCIDIVDKNNINYQINQWYASLCNSKNWLIKHYTKYKYNFLFNETTKYITLTHKKYNELKEINMNIEIDLSNNMIPVKEVNQFYQDLQLSPLFNSIKIENKVEVLQEGDYGYLVDVGKTYLTAKVSLVDFNNKFYNYYLNNVYSEIIQNSHQWKQNYLNKLNQHFFSAREINFIPIILVTIGVFVLLFLIWLIIKHYKYRIKF